MKVCIVANNPNVCHIPDEYDVYVHFNWANNFALTPNSKSILAMRYNKIMQELKRVAYHDYSHYAKKIIAIGGVEEIRKIDQEVEIIDTLSSPAPEGQKPFPTSGFAAIHYYLNKGYDVTICGFDIEKALYYGRTRHPLDWEKEQIAKMISEGTIKSI
jgi:hypothetical protein